MNDFLDFVAEYLIPVLLIFLIVIVMVSSLVIPIAYYGSCRSAEVYNKQNATSYSCSDFFWAGSQINSQTQTLKIAK